MLKVATDIAVGPERVVAESLGFLEAPRWRDGHLWFSDFYSRRVCSVDESGEITRHFYVPGQPSGLGLCSDGTVLVVSMHDGRLLRGRPGGPLSVHADIGSDYRGSLNDLAVDAAGRAYISTLPAPEGHSDPLDCPIFFVDSDGTARVVARGLQIPNGMAVTHDGRWLIVAETRAGRLVRFPVDTDGSLGDRQVFADLDGRKPDGLCLDPSGAVWVCCPFTSEFLLVDDAGVIRAQRQTPGSWAVACALGGANSDELFVLTADVTLETFQQGGGSGAIRGYRIGGR
jgi:sugar lactone lactonase YvrE